MLPQNLAEAWRAMQLGRLRRRLRCRLALHSIILPTVPFLGPLPSRRFVLAHLTDTDPRVKEEGIPRTHGPAIYSWFAHAFT